MITLIGPITDGLAQAISDAGHYLRAFQAPDGTITYRTADDAAVQAIIDDYPIQSRRNEKKREIDAHARKLRDSITAQYSPAEMSAWPLKLSQAQEHRRGNSAPLLQAEADARRVPIDAIVDRVETNAAQLSGLEAQIAGVAGRHKDALDALDDPWAIWRYDYSGGWSL